MAVLESYRGNFIPFFKSEFNINNTKIGFIVMSSTLGSVIGSFFAGQMCEKLGHKPVFIVGTIISTIAVLFTPFISNIYLLSLFYLVFGIGRSTLSISIDSLIPVLSIGFEVILMNLAHFMYGLGSFIGQGICGKLLSSGIPWKNIYLYLGVFFAISIIFSSFMKIPTITASNTSNNLNKTKNLNFYKNPTIYYFVFALMFIVISESMASTWFINYLRSTYNFEPDTASKYAS